MTSTTIPQPLLDALPVDVDLEQFLITTVGDLESEHDVEIAQHYRGDVPNESVAVLLPGWSADDGNADVDFPDAESGSEAAKKYVETGDWDEDGSSFAIRVRAWRTAYALDDEDAVIELRVDDDSHLVIQHPEPPECEASNSGQHSWIAPYELVGGIKENPGVRGGTGCSIISTDVCAYCGMAYISVSNSQGVDTEHDHDTVRYTGDVDDGAVTIDQLAEYHDTEMPDGLDSDSELAAAIRRRILQDRIDDLERWADSIDTMHDGDLILHGVSDESVSEIEALLGPGYQAEWWGQSDTGGLKRPPQDGDEIVLMVRVDA